MYRWLGLALLIVFPFSNSTAASFDCSKASTINEKLICKSSNLSRLDERYAKLYRQTKSQSSPAAEVKQEAIAALKQRGSVCRDEACLTAWYRYRIFVLEIKLDNLSRVDNSQASSESASSEASLNCSAAYTTLDLNRCFARKVSRAEEVMNGYYEKVTESYSHDGVAQTSIEKGQSAWQAYRVAHCGAVYDIWRDGSIKTLRYLVCELELVRKRTYELWETFLTFEDSTPAVVPEPFPIAATTY